MHKASKFEVLCRLDIAQQYNNQTYIVSPVVGNVICKKRINGGEVEHFVVTNISVNAKGLTNICHLQKITNGRYVNNQLLLEYENNKFHLILRLSSAGTWITKDMRKQFDWDWQTTLSNDLLYCINAQQISLHALFQQQGQPFSPSQPLQPHLYQQSQGQQFKSMPKDCQRGCESLESSLESSASSNCSEQESATIILTPPKQSWLLNNQF